LDQRGSIDAKLSESNSHSTTQVRYKTHARERGTNEGKTKECPASLFTFRNFVEFEPNCLSSDGQHVEEGKQGDSGDYEVTHDATMVIASKRRNKNDGTNAT
jgi:hypothetical protein